MNDYRDYLSHHGVKGQQWGVRHGPPYPIEDKVLRKGTKLASVRVEYTKSELKSRANNAKIMRKTLKMKLRDGSIKEEEREDYEKAIEAYENGRPKDAWLYTYNPDDPHDSDVYKGAFSTFLRQYKGQQIVEETFEVKKDLVMPSLKERKKEFNNLYDDPKFTQSVIDDLYNCQQRLVRQGVNGWERYINIDVTNLKTKEDYDIAYEIFNHAMESKHSNKSTNEYGKRMESKYDAMVDDNNVNKYNNAHDPVIIFRVEDALDKIGDAKPITDQEIEARYERLWDEIGRKPIL